MIFILGCGVFIWNSYKSSIFPEELIEPIVVPVPEPDEAETLKTEFPVPSVDREIRKQLLESDAEPDDEAPLPEEAVEDIPLPELNESDVPLNEALAEFFPAGQLFELFSFKDVIRHFTVTIDNAMGAKLPRKYSFSNHPETRFVAQETSKGKYVMSEANFDRYSGFVHFIEDVEVNHVVYVYVKFYPLFQKAYEELGYPDRYFNDRLIEVVDHLLATPESPQEIVLVKPKVFFEFADPELERLSASQKMMLRIGPENAAKVKEKLAALRASLTSLN